MTLTVTTTTGSNNNATRCVKLTGDQSATLQSANSQSSWVFTGLLASPVEGLKSITATAYTNDGCNGNSGSQTFSYTVDNTGPVVTGTPSPTPNAAGWNKNNVTVSWAATDAGSGVFSGPTPTTNTVNAEASGQVVTSSAADRVGNSSTGSVTVKLDKSAPTITGTRTPVANSYGWNNTNVTVSFTCSDTRSGIKSCIPSGPQTVSSQGANQSVTGTATDNADNTTPATVPDINIDKTAPLLSGAPTSSPNANGWYNGDVTVAWVCSDALAGVDGSCPANSTIGGEGIGLSSTRSVSDKAGNSTTATSSPTVRIDRTAPTTLANAPTAWQNSTVTVLLTPNDNLSGVAHTHYSVDGGATQSGTTITLSDEGVHDLEFWSVDNAGNIETANSASVKIDKTAPTIAVAQIPEANASGWNNSSVTVTFTCGDTLSGVASCTAPVTVSGEGAGQPVQGTATDNAGNSNVATTSVSVDLTKPLVDGSRSPLANSAGWSNGPVTVSFSCSDALSGIASCSAPVTVSTEGAGQSVTGHAADTASNTDSDTVSNINIDLTPPTLTGVANPTANGQGWWNDDVTIDWSCDDTLSGINGPCPVDTVVTGEGENLKPSQSVTDNAGNLTTTTVGGINIDRNAPVTTDNAPTGWNNHTVTVGLNAVDSLSGIKTTKFQLDDGPVQTGDQVTVTDEGTTTITYWSTDNADNTEQAHTATVRIDKTDPTITNNAPAGWVNNSSLLVTFTCDDDRSGVATCEGDTVVTDEGVATVTGAATDNAGNTASDTATVRIDRTAPVTTDNAPTGWQRDDVTVTLTAEDQPDRAGVAATHYQLDGGPDTLGTEVDVTGDGVHTLTYWSTDNAGNTETTHTIQINIDKTDPTIAWSGGPAVGGTYPYGSVPAAPGCTASDLLSGPNGCALLGYGTGVGLHTMTVTAYDNAGNTTVETRTYTVLAWNLKGFYAPVDMNGVYNTVKNGSTVPMKFELFSGSTELMDVAAVGSLTYAQTACDTNAITDDIEATATGSTALRYDSTAGQYIYNWKTPSTAGKCYRVTMTAQDGSTLKAYFKLK